VPLSPHTRLGPYEIVSAIGAGGMGEVSRHEIHATAALVAAFVFSSSKNAA